MSKAKPPTNQRLKKLEEENCALGEQVKSLMRTEQRLHRSQIEIDQQLSRIHSLGDFALDCTAQHDTEHILHRASELLLESFDLDCITIVRPAPELNLMNCSRVHPDEEGKPFDVGCNPTISENFCSAPAPFLVQVEGEQGAWLGPFFTRHEQAPEDKLVLVVPLKVVQDELFAILLGHKTMSGKPSFFREMPAAKHLPFLRLLASHAQGALSNAKLTRELQAHSKQLAETNHQLKASLESLETTQQQLLQAQKMEAVGRLAGGVAHDFNNLLTVILSHAQLLKMGLEPGSEEAEDVGQILEAGDRAAKITTQLLAFSRKQKPNPKPLDLNELSRGMVRMLKRLIGEHIRLEIDLEAGLDPIKADRGQLEQIILNLVVNARDAMPQGGTITVSTRRCEEDDLGHPESERRGGYLALTILDTGCGMDEGTRQQAFEPFFTTKGVGQGTGMGLAIVYGLVQQNLGSVRVQSTLGQGTCFTLLFPTIRGGLPNQNPSLAPFQLKEARGGTILLVEDEDSIRGVARRVLRQEGFEVLEASNGREALEVAERAGRPIDLLLTDVVMPLLGGVKLAELLRARHPHLKVIFMSGYTFDQLDTHQLAQEDLHFIPKPFTPDILVSGVALVLTKRGMRAPLHPA